MPYVTDAERFRALWMTPAEAVAHVCEADKCSAEAAKKQIQFALKDRKIRTRWADVESRFLNPDANDDFHPTLLISEIGAQGSWPKSYHSIINWNSGTARNPAFKSKKRYSFSQIRADDEAPSSEERAVLLLKSNVSQIWTLLENAAGTAGTAEPLYHTGLAGRPTAWHLVEAEVKRRWKSKKYHNLKLSTWADDMHAWLKASHPNAPNAEVKTLSNNIRPLLLTLRASQQNQ